MMMVPAPPTPLAVALGCPWCGCPSNPSPSVQTCAGCQKRFTLSAGPALDAAVVPAPFHPASPRIPLRWSAVVTYQFATLEPPGIHAGTLDPVMALSPIEQTSIAYGDVVSIAVWRKLGIVDCVVAVLVPLPIALFCGWIAILIAFSRVPSFGAAAVFAAIALAMGALAVYLFRRGVVIGKRKARVVGRWGSSTAHVETSPAFVDELFRRCGIVRPPVP